MKEAESWTMRDSVAVLMLSNPPVNAISQAVRAAIVAGVARANAEPEVSALVIACAGRTFFAGADLREFGQPATEPFLTDVVDTIEGSKKPVIAAIHGSALGGGLEIAMACHYRVAVADSRLGLPEVKLGLMPGARGTQQLPRLIGIEQALKMAALGDPVTALTAKGTGLVDAIADGDLIDAACALARDKSGFPLLRTRDLVAAPVADQVYEEFIQRNARKFRGLDAPPAIIASIRAASELPFDEGARRERESFLQLRSGPQNEALRHVFFAERQASKVPEIEGIAPRSIMSAGVIGSGTMGSGIAICLLAAGIPVSLYERDPAALERGIAQIGKALSDNVRSGRMNQQQADSARAILQPVHDMALLGEADLIIEAAYETIEVKQAIFAELDSVAKAHAILASNTSYLDIDAIASATSRPRDVIGLHFFSPANVMKLLEIVRGTRSAPDVIATAFVLAKRIGKIGVLSGNAHGFIGNRMLAVRRSQAEAMVLQGANPARVDAVLERFGFAMGPFRMADLAGLDLGWSSEQSTGSTIRERLCEADRRGQKNGAGFYDYDDKRQPVASELAVAIISGLAQDQGITQHTFTDEEILDRLLWPMVDEGAKILAEGIALRESDIDVVWLNGYGWPAWTGGPMFHARKIGLAEVSRRLSTLGLDVSKAIMDLAAKQQALN